MVTAAIFSTAIAGDDAAAGLKSRCFGFANNAVRLHPPLKRAPISATAKQKSPNAAAVQNLIF